MKKVMLLAAMLAMVLAAAVPALAQSVTQVGSSNVACVQTAIQANFGTTQIAASQYGDATNINIQSIAQECNIAVEQVNTVVNKALTVNKAGDVVVVASASASANKVLTVNEAGDVVVVASASASPSHTATASASATAPAAVQYQYAAPEVQYSATASPTAELPPTGGSSLIALGAGVLLVAGGLLARRIVR